MTIEPSRVGRIRWQTLLQWVALYLVGAAVLGALAAVFWVLVVDLPGYVVLTDGRAITTERDLTGVFTSDAWFAGIGVVLGLGVGVIAWRWFRPLGWPAVALAGAGALTAGMICWFLGSLLGPSAFQDRLAQAEPGEFVPISLELRSPVVLALWVMMAVLPVLLGSALARDPDDSGPRGTTPFAAVPVSVPSDWPPSSEYGARSASAAESTTPILATTAASDAESPGRTEGPPSQPGGA